jgi:alpha-methylacyl-CoA racemase
MQDPMEAGLALVGVRTLDLSRLIPGPYCSRILADFGSEVIKIEHPQEGDWVRYVLPLDPHTGESLLFQVLNRGKKSLGLNLKTEAGRRILIELIQTADVLLEGFRPGVMERLGLAYERMAQVNPRLVYCSLSGYGPRGAYRQQAGHDLNYLGLAGMLDLNGPWPGPPVAPGTQIADLMGGIWAAVGILVALVARERTGRGRRVEASLLGAALSTMPVAFARLRGGQPMQRGASDLTGGWVCYHVYETGDGRYVTLAALEPQFWAAFCAAVGRPEWIGEQFAPAVPGEPAYEALGKLFRSRTRREWAKALAGVDACCEPVYALSEALQSAPIQALGMLSGEGLLPPVRLAGWEAGSMSPAPQLGAHSAALLSELGYDPLQIEQLRQVGAI